MQLGLFAAPPPPESSEEEQKALLLAQQRRALFLEHTIGCDSDELRQEWGKDPDKFVYRFTPADRLPPALTLELLGVLEAQYANRLPPRRLLQSPPPAFPPGS